MYKKSLFAKDRKGAGWVAIGQGGMPGLQGVEQAEMFCFAKKQLPKKCGDPLDRLFFAEIIHI